ncbi:MAG: hypothetical protein OXI43_18590 [Candidatus Poribacteria bacterium]|nr:hypothetical protein [Candidatus Poribacteria bacterium]
MRNIIGIFIMSVTMPFLFTGQSAYTNQTDDPLADLSLPEVKFKPKFRIKVSVKTETGPKSTNDLVKGYMIAALRKIPDVTIVGQNEHYEIALVPIETVGGYAVAYRVLSPIRVDTIINDVHFNARERVRKYLSMAYVPYHFGIFTASKDGLERQCRVNVVQFDAGTLQSVREMYE